MSFLSYIFPQKLVSIPSNFNGNIDVVESFGKKYIEVGGLMQSGNFVEKIFRKGLQKLKLDKENLSHILIIGVGGGSFVRVCQNLFPKARIVGVEIDPKMVELGEKFLHFHPESAMQIIIADIFQRPLDKTQIFDLIFVDIYQGYAIHREAEDAKFLKYLASKTKKNGVLIFNRLYFQKYISEANYFLDKLQGIFQDVKSVKVYSNLLIVVKL